MSTINTSSAGASRTAQEKLFRKREKLLRRCVFNRETTAVAVLVPEVEFSRG